MMHQTGDHSMSKYRQRLPQLGNTLFITEGGIETTLIFHESIDLPYFASFDLLKDDAGWRVLRRSYDRYAQIARANQIGIVLETPTWRASADWGARLGYDATALADINRKAVSLLLEIRDAYETARTPVVISGNLGPRGDGYRPATRMNTRQARDYHAVQIATFAQTDADMTAAFTMNYIEEAVGIVQAARMHAMPVAISFTLETDGRLPSGDTLEQAITRTDAETDGYATYYMINCAHPVHFLPALAADGAWRERIRGVRANASRRSHAELDECTDLDSGNPHEFGGQYRELKTMLPRLSVMGGCCGTDHRHMDEICRALLAA
jgi:S-methylmethionine-dependent homocysteine/selenocysteine methylase